MHSSMGVKALLLALPLVLPAFGDTVTPYLDRDLWEAATSEQRLIDFELGRPLANGTYEQFGTFAGVTLDAIGGIPGVDQVNFVGIYYNGAGDPVYSDAFIINPPAGASEYWGSGNMFRGPAYRTTPEPARTRVTLPAGGVQAVGLDLRSADSAGQPFQILLYDGVSSTPFYSAIVTTVDPGPSLIHSFWGATSTIPVTMMDIILLGDRITETVPLIDNFTYASVGSSAPPATVPEPATAPIFLALGLAGLIVSRLRR
ncbi:MAG: hypothetical protein IRZ15_09840 [Bryobacteraceae bacterium]|nr:hypothetical protein [Bryobacteraceae bacterium]